MMQGNGGQDGGGEIPGGAGGEGGGSQIPDLQDVPVHGGDLKLHHVREEKGIIAKADGIGIKLPVLRLRSRRQP